MASIYYKVNEIEQAILFQNEAINIFKCTAKNIYTDFMASTLRTYSKYLEETNNLNDALDYLGVVEEI